MWKTFDKGGRPVEALQGVELDIARNEFAAILGPSGCGKSTLLNMVAGFDAPTRGDGALRRRAGRRAPSPRRAVVFQEPALFPWYTVLDNVTFGPRTRGHRRRRRTGSGSQTIIEQVGPARLRVALSGRALGRHEAARGHRARAGHGARACC